MPELTPQEVRIKVENGQLILDPPIRDLYRGEEIKWISAEENWEVLFEEEETPVPFFTDSFGPGMEDSLVAPPDELGDEELPRYLSGRPRRPVADVVEVDYTARVRDVGDRRGSIRIFRRARPL